MSIRPILGLALLLMAGCAETDPYRRPGMWQPEGANAANIAAMVERPSDLVRGRSDRTPEIRQGRDAVERLWDDRQRSWSGKDRANTGAAGSASPAAASSKEGT
jgi:type IV pilus biogenesis protein CpaD/CtpE